MSFKASDGDLKGLSVLGQGIEKAGSVAAELAGNAIGEKAGEFAGVVATGVMTALVDKAANAAASLQFKAPGGVQTLVEEVLPVFEDIAVTSTATKGAQAVLQSVVGSVATNALRELGEKNFEVEIGSGDRLEMRQFAIHERLSSLFQVSLLVASFNPSIELDEVVGQAAKFSMAAGQHDRFWSGICNHFEQIRVEPTGLSTYSMSIVPTLWLLTQRKNYRMFQQISEPDIVLKLLSEWGIQPTVRIDRKAYKKRKYRVQYNESDFAFMSRMLEDAGITFSFEQEGQETKLVLSDAPQASPRRAGSLLFMDDTSGKNDIFGEFVTAVRIGQRVRPGKYTVRDHDYRKPPNYKVMSSASRGLPIEEKLERFQYVPGAFLFGAESGDPTPSADDKGKTRTDEKEAQALAQRRIDAKRGGARVTTFDTNAHDLAPGVVVTIAGHAHHALGDDKALLVVESSLSGSADGEWSHHCEGRSVEIPFRPELVTRKPRVQGVESATVVGPAGEEIHCDEFGRVRVHFHWDRESQMDDNSSCWIHVSQPWGGAGYGGMALPRIGQEVLVDFLSGDPDRPVIIGRVYTNLQKPPYTLPANKTQTGLRSNSTGGGGGYNELMFEDEQGKEVVRFQAERDATGLIKHDARLNIQNDCTLNVGNNHTVGVVGDETLRVGKNRRVRVKLDLQHSVEQNITVQAVEGTTTHLSKQAILHWSDEKIVLCAGAASFIEITKEKITIQSPRVDINPGAGQIPPPPQPPAITDATAITGFIGAP